MARKERNKLFNKVFKRRETKRAPLNSCAGRRVSSFKKSRRLSRPEGSNERAYPTARKEKETCPPDGLTAPLAPPHSAILDATLNASIDLPLFVTCKGRISVQMHSRALLWVQCSLPSDSKKIPNRQKLAKLKPTRTNAVDRQERAEKQNVFARLWGRGRAWAPCGNGKRGEGRKRGGERERFLFKELLAFLLAGLARCSNDFTNDPLFPPPAKSEVRV